MARNEKVLSARLVFDEAVMWSEIAEYVAVVLFSYATDVHCQVFAPGSVLGSAKRACLPFDKDPAHPRVGTTAPHSFPQCRFRDPLGRRGVT